MSVRLSIILYEILLTTVASALLQLLSLLTIKLIGIYDSLMTAKKHCCAVCAGVQITGSLMKLFSYIIFIPLQIAFIPLTILGILFTAYKQIIVSK